MAPLKTRVISIVYNSVFSIVSLVFAFLGNLAIFPIFPFLRADFSDAPIFLATLILGIPSGISVFLIVSIIRSLLFSSTGPIGFILRSSSIIMILALGIFREEKIRVFYKIISILLGAIFCIITKIYLSQFFWINFFSISKEFINSVIYVIILPYNVIKILTNIILAFIAQKHIKKYMKYEIINI